MADKEGWSAPYIDLYWRADRADRIHAQRLGQRYSSRTIIVRWMNWYLRCTWRRWLGAF